MKKIVTFSNFMVLLGIMTILFYLIPAVTIKIGTYSTAVNLFTATFGGGFSIMAETEVLGSCGASAGLITAFVLGIVGIVFSLAKMKVKFANLLACPFYIAAGVLVACAGQLTDGCTSNPTIFRCSIAAGAITVATFFCILGAFALIDFIAAVAKPKQVNPAY